jgi:hypothetical protein
MLNILDPSSHYLFKELSEFRRAFGASGSQVSVDVVGCLREPATNMLGGFSWWKETFTKADGAETKQVSSYNGKCARTRNKY